MLRPRNERIDRNGWSRLRTSGTGLFRTRLHPQIRGSDDSISTFVLWNRPSRHSSYDTCPGRPDSPVTGLAVKKEIW